MKGSLDPEQVPGSLTFLDEATASLDESSRAELYHLLKGELPATKHRLDRAIAASLRRGDHCASGLQQGRNAVLTYVITKASARAGAGSIRPDISKQSIPASLPCKALFTT